MRPIRYLPVVAVATLLSACASQAPRDLDTVAVRGVPQLGNDFQKALSQNYVDLAQIELDEGHRDAATYYNTRSRQAAAGKTVTPVRMDERAITAVKAVSYTHLSCRRSARV